VVAPIQPFVHASAFDLTSLDRAALEASLGELLSAVAAGAVIVGAGWSLFDRLGLAAQAPRQLDPMPRFTGDAVVDADADGDLSVIVQGSSRDGVEAQHGAVIEALTPVASLRWHVAGGADVDPNAPPGRAPGRNLLGFRDGTANPDRADPEAMGRLVWVGAGAGEAEMSEPTWAQGGSYQVLRVIRLDLAAWEALSIERQEATIGRVKESGAPLGADAETDVADYSADPDGVITPLSSHVRLANPAGGAAGQTMLRRSTNYARGPLDQGLLFSCYQSSMQRGFLTVQGRLNGEPLSRYATTVGGGAFYVLPSSLALED
jgi:deferrochelatase/peroxidase EfeB